MFPYLFMLNTYDGYTKHYFMGADRIGTTIGGGNNGNWLVDPVDVLEPYEEQRLFDLGDGSIYGLHYYDVYDYPGQNDHTENTDYTGTIEYGDVGYSKYQYQKDEFQLKPLWIDFKDELFEHYLYEYFQNDKTDEPYYYHSDHLGSAAWITDGQGLPVQYIMYAPYGEELLNQQPFSYNERFTFTGKERDAETGYDYFGSRYRESNFLNHFISVDPLADKFIDKTPYLYCEGNPIKFVDLDGRFPLSFPLINYIALAWTLENSQGNHVVKTAGYSMLYPINALRTGDATFPQGSISNIACRFQVNLENEAGFSNGIGGQSNAYRHTLWQAILTNTFGSDHAIRIGNAHEDNLPKDMSARLFSDKNDADTMADLLNNIIGRGIAANNKGLSNKQYAELVLKEYKTNGLWVVAGNTKDGYTILKSKLTQEQYDRALQVVETRGNNGLLEQK